MALASRGSLGELSGEAQTLTGPIGLSVNQLHSSRKEEDTASHETVAVLPSETPGFRTTGAAPYPRPEAPTGPPSCCMCWTLGHRIPDCEILT